MTQTGFNCSGIIIADPDRLRGTGMPAAEPIEKPGPAELLAVFESLFDDIILVAADPASFLEYDRLIVSDHFAPVGLWSGIHAGLFAARHPHAFVAACGSPPVSAELICFFMEAVAPRNDAVLAAGQNAPLPLPGVYSKNCLKPLASQLAQGDSQGFGWLRRVRVHTLTPQEPFAAVPDRRLVG